MTALKAPSPLALLRETFTPVTFASLLASSPFLAAQQRGYGETVLVWPGFGAGNASTTALRGYLNYLGYDAQGWSVGTNNGDVLRLLDEFPMVLWCWLLWF